MQRHDGRLVEHTTGVLHQAEWVVYKQTAPLSRLEIQALNQAESRVSKSGWLESKCMARGGHRTFDGPCQQIKQVPARYRVVEGAKSETATVEGLNWQYCRRQWFSNKGAVSAWRR